MKVSVKIAGEKTILDFNIKKIIRQFLSLEEPGNQLNFMEKKMAEMALLNGLGRRKISPISRMKRLYLIQYRHLDFILNGLLKMAQDNAGAA